MSLSAIEYLRHILDETGYLMDRVQGLTWDQFMRDATLKRAFVRSLEIIGEASKQIPDDFKQKVTISTMLNSIACSASDSLVSSILIFVKGW